MRTRQEISSHSSQEGCFLNEAALPERRMELDKSIYVGPTETLELPENLTLRIQSERGIQAHEGFWILTAAAASLESFKPNAKLNNCSEPRPNLEKNPKPKTLNPKPQTRWMDLLSYRPAVCLSSSRRQIQHSPGSSSSSRGSRTIP